MIPDRERMLLSAAEFLGRRPNATQEELARAVGLSRASLHRHFATRAAILTAVEELAIAKLADAVADAQLTVGPADEALRRLVDAVMPMAGCLALLFTLGQDYAFDEDHPGWQMLDAALSGLFERGQSAGIFRPELQPRWLTDALASLVAAAPWSMRLGRLSQDSAIEGIAGLLLRGAMTDSYR